MEQERFDRLTRLLGETFDRRRGLAAAIAAAGGFVAASAEARRRAPEPEGPCGNGKRKDNICTKDSQCCTDYCDTSIGKKNKDGKGRCRCIRKGKPCSKDKNCCQGSCVSGVCGGGGASCMVCASGCPYATVAAAIAASASGAVITIDAGTYDEDLTVDKTLTLTNCNGAAVTLRNATQGSRTIVFPDPAVVPAITLTIDSITITSSSGVGNDGGGIQGFANLVLQGTALVRDCEAVEGGGVRIGDGQNNTVYTVVMNDTSAITGNSASGDGGGIFIDSYSTLTMNDSSVISDNVANGGDGGGGAYIYYSSRMTMNDNALVSNNKVTAAGGGIYLYAGGPEQNPLTMNGSAKVMGNEAMAPTGYGGGIALDDDQELLMTGQSTITGNTSATSGGGIYTVGKVTLQGSASITNNTAGTIGGGVYNDAGTITMTMSGTSTISGNTATTFGGGVYLDDAELTMNDSTSVTGNTAPASAGGGVYGGGSSSILTLNGSASVTANTNGNCAGTGVSC